MITSINKANNASYQNYFNEVSKYLLSHDNKGHYITDDDYDSDDKLVDMGKDYVFDPEAEEYNFITSLEELFTWMAKIREVRPQLTRLPLDIDESCFNINANTRVIDIPSQFLKDGVFSVEGDEIAESVYFRINRFFDHMDLNTQHILIQYRNAKGEEFASIPPMVDVESDPGFIIFEWPISSKVTAAAGNVEFSVRFFDYDDSTLDEQGHGKIVYSLSTLPKTISVKASQNFDLVSLNEEESSRREDNKQFMVDRLQRDPLYGPNTFKALPPIFWEDLPLVIDLEEDPETGYYDAKKEVQVEAYSDSGHISYSWSKKTLEGGTPVTLESHTKIVESNDSSPKQGKIYYTAIMDGDKISGYNKENSLSTFKADTKYYEKVSYVFFDSVGYYQATATNQVGTALAHTQTPAAKVVDEDGNESINNWCLVPAPQYPVMGPIADSLVLAFADPTDKFEGVLTAEASSSADEHGKLSYQWYYSPTGEDDYVAIEGATGVEFTVTGDTEVMEIVDEQGELIVDENGDVIADVPEEEVVKYEDGDTVVVETMISTGNGAYGTNNETGKKTVFVPAVVDGLASADGFYKAKVINHLNGEVAFKDTNVCRVTHPAIKPDFDYTENSKDYAITKDYRYQVTKASATSNGIEVKVEIPEFAAEKRNAEDKLEFQWFRYSNDISDEKKFLEKLNEDSVKAYSGRYVVNNDFRVKESEGTVFSSSDLYEGSSKIFLTEEVLKKGQYFFCRVMNVYNGSKTTRCSMIFEVVTK